MNKNENPSKRKNNKIKNDEKKENKQLNAYDCPAFDLDEKLEYDPRAYSYLDYIALEYPSQTIINKGQNLIVSECNKENSHLIEFEFHDISKNTKYSKEKLPLNFEVNRLRANDQVIIGSSDHEAFVMNNEFEIEVELNKSFSYGLAVNQDKGFFGTKSGKVIVFDLVNNQKTSVKIHENGIDGIALSDNLLFTASNDRTLKITDLRNNELVRKIDNDCDVNAVDTHGSNYVFGDDKGILYFYDIRKDEIIEKIHWHQNAINSVFFPTDEMFVGVSDEQVALFDTTLEPSQDWNAHKWLWFVHRGQNYYKEICLIVDLWCVTSLQGICVFKPTDSIDDKSSDSSEQE